MFTKKANKFTDKEIMDKMDRFSHSPNLKDGMTAQQLIQSTYNAGSIKRERYNNITRSFLDNSNRLRILEVGAGPGDFLVFCSKFFPQHEYHVSDVSDILKNNIHYAEEHFGTHFKGKLFVFDAEKIPYPDNSFDIVFARSCVHHFEDPRKAFKEIYRVLTKGGKFVFFNDPACLNLPIYKSFYKYFSTKEFRKAGLNEHVYTISEYMSFGPQFAERKYVIDEAMINDFTKNAKQWGGLKKMIAALSLKNRLLLRWLFLARKRKSSSFIFTFLK